ncbi:MAG: Na+/H+ antiporter subunit E [Acidimicrobiales bacterium]|jgi:multicomponent Na+:H+ antiporter subunit E|nr:Na+/H+ antiporter subunit E [Acidimicrobiales bacterium]
MSATSLLRRVLNSVVLLAVWVALWGEPSVGNLLSGIAAIVVVNLVFPTGPDVVAAEDEGTPRLVAAVKFLGIFGWALLVANVQVVVAVLRPRLRIAEGIVAVPLVSRSPIIATMVANAISLTPGTLTVEIGGGGANRPGGAAGRATPGVPSGAEPPVVLYVHALDLADADAVRADGRRFEELAVAAFGSATDRARIEESAS